MKRSEMIERLVFYILESSGHDDATDFAEGILDWLEEQGMHPPTYAVSLDEDSRTHTTILMWEPEDEE